jgi:hypothetical protein
MLQKLQGSVKDRIEVTKSVLQNQSLFQEKLIPHLWILVLDEVLLFLPDKDVAIGDSPSYDSI